jgi:hypothetical protein
MKKVVFAVVAVAVVAAAGWSYQQNKQSVELSDLAMENVEALATGESDYKQKIWERYYREEGDGYNCTKGGSETC